MSTESLVHLFLPATLAMIMLAMGLGLTLDDFEDWAKNPAQPSLDLAVRWFFCRSVASPWHGFSASTRACGGVVVLTACPGGAHSNLFTNLARGDTALSVTLTAVSGILTIVTIPLIAALSIWVFSDGSSEISLPWGESVAKVFGLMAFPISVGMLVRSRSARVAEIAERVVKTIAVLMLVLIIVGAVGKESGRIPEFCKEVGLAVVVLNIGTMLIGFGVTRLLAIPADQTIAIVMEVGIQNSALAVGLTMGFFGSILRFRQ